MRNIFNNGWKKEISHLKGELHVVTAERDTLYDEINVLRQELEELGQEYDELEAKYRQLLEQQPRYHCNPEDVYREGFNSTDDYNTFFDKV